MPKSLFAAVGIAGLADISKKSHGRLFYSCVVPAMNIDAAIEEIKFAKENGAAAVCMRPLEGDRHLSDPYFYPLYQAASDLDLSIAVHIANGNPENADLYRLAPAGRFAQFRVPTVTACFDVIMSELHESISQAALGLYRSLGAVGAVDLPRSGDPLPRRRQNFSEECLRRLQHLRHLPGQRRRALHRPLLRRRTAW